MDRLAGARQAAVVAANAENNLPLLVASTTLEYGACVPDKESNIYGLVTVQAPPCFIPEEASSLTVSRVPIDLVCVVDQSGSMGGEKMALLKDEMI